MVCASQGEGYYGGGEAGVALNGMLMDSANGHVKANHRHIRNTSLPPLLQEHIKALRQFIEWSLEQPDVYYVTASQLVEWMKNPVPVSQVADTLTCRIVDLKPPGEYKHAQQQR